MKRRPTILLVLLATLLLPSRAAFSQMSVDVWGRAGLFLPSDDTLGDVYSGARIPLVAQAEWRIHSAVALFGGVRYLRADGRAIGEDETGDGSQGTSTRLTTTSGRFGGLLVLQPGQRWDVRVGGGVTVSNYEETWASIGASTSGTRSGWLAQAGVAYRLTRHWLAGATAEYSGVRVPASDGDAPTPAVDLGGLDILFGLGFRF